jgi:hypothetical protein
MEYWVERNEDNQKNDSFRLLFAKIPSFRFDGTQKCH